MFAGERSLTLNVLVAFLLTVPVSPVRAQNLEAAKASVVRIVSKTPEGIQRIGTGFVVRVDADLAYIATASHVVEGDPAPQIEFFARRNRPIIAGILKSEGGDPKGVALLLVRGSDNIPIGLHALSFAPTADVQSGQDVAVIGFGQGQGDWAVIRASIASVQGRDLRLDGRIEEGNSGGPVLRDAQVVALVTSVSQGFGVAMQSLFVEAILKGWGIDVSAAQPVIPTSYTLAGTWQSEGVVFGVVPDPKEEGVFRMEQIKPPQEHLAFYRAKLDGRSVQMDKYALPSGSHVAMIKAELSLDGERIIGYSYPGGYGPDYPPVAVVFRRVH